VATTMSCVSNVVNKANVAGELGICFAVRSVDVDTDNDRDDNDNW